MELVPYVVRQGDYLLSLAAKNAFDPDAIWAHARNDRLRLSRKDPNMLLPGDVLYIPVPPKDNWLPVKIGATNTFKAKPVLVSISVKFTADGEALAGEPYEIDGAPVDAGSLDGDGFLHGKVPTYVKVFLVRFPKRNEHYAVQVGHLDPPESASGMRMRLGMLGIYGNGPSAGADDADDLAAGLRLFQWKHSLSVTGAIDDATVSKVVEVFGR